MLNKIVKCALKGGGGGCGVCDRVMIDFNGKVPPTYFFVMQKICRTFLICLIVDGVVKLMFNVVLDCLWREPTTHIVEKVLRIIIISQ